MKQFQKLEIIWFDSAHSTGWLKEDRVQCTPYEALKHFTIGYFLRRSKFTIIVVQSYNIDLSSTQVDSIMEIPLRSIIKIKKL